MKAALQLRRMPHRNRHSSARHNGAVGKPADYTCKRTFHACNGDNDACAHDFVNMRKEPVQPCNADIIKPKHTAAVEFRRQCRFFGNGNIACAACRNNNAAVSARFGDAADTADFAISQ